MSSWKPCSAGIAVARRRSEGSNRRIFPVGFAQFTRMWLCWTKNTSVPKQPYLDWANGLDEDGVQIGDDFMPERTVYLVEDVTDVELDVEAIMTPHVAAI
jgi:hypothetical protein